MIKGGTPAQANVLRSTVKVTFGYSKYNDNSLCTGTIIDNKGILTAQHCFQSSIDPTSNAVVKPDKISIYFINAEGEPVGESCLADKTYLAPGYDVNKSQTLVQSSVDVLYLSHNCNLPSGFGPAPILPPDHIDEGDELIVAGYGKTDDDPKSPAASRLTQISMALKSGMFEDKAKGIKRNIKAIDQFVDPSGNPFGYLSIQAIVAGTGTCQGDSGGPIYKAINGVIYLAAVHTTNSRTPKEFCAGTSGLSFGAMAANHLPWIESALGRKLSTRQGNSEKKATNTSEQVQKEVEEMPKKSITLPEMKAQKPEESQKMAETQNHEMPQEKMELPKFETPKKIIELPEIPQENAEQPESVKPKKNIEIRQLDWKKILESVKKVKSPKLDIEDEISKPAKKAPKAKTTNGLSFGKQPSFCSTTFPSATGEVQSAFLTQAAQILKPAQRGRCRAESQNGVQSFAEEIKGEIGEEGKMECLKIYCDARTN